LCANRLRSLTRKRRLLRRSGIFFAVAFTEFYPRRAGTKASLAAGETPDEPAPPAIKLVDWLPSRLSPAIDSNV
jgi:hypothetical protein